MERAKQTVQWAVSVLGDDKPLIDEYDLTPEEAETLLSRLHTALVEMQAILGTALSGKTAASTTATKPKKSTAKVTKPAAKAEKRTPARRGGAGRRGSRSDEFYSKIGKKGGEAVKEKHGPEFYAGIGKKGGGRRPRSDRASIGPVPPFGSNA
jgi:general stress protein YciG